MDKTFINIFNGVTDTSTNKKISVLDVIWKISEGKWKELIEEYRSETDKKTREAIKKRLPAVTFSGYIDGDERLDKEISRYTGIIVCDIDKIKVGELNRHKRHLKEDGYVLAFFESPSRGLKVLIKVDSGLEYHKSHAFIQIERYLMDHYQIKIDPSGKNPSRLCFISYDPDLYYNEEAEVMKIDTTIDYEKLEQEMIMESVKNIQQNADVSNDSRYVFETLVDWISKSKVGPYRKGNRNVFIFSLSCLLSEYGMDMDMSISMIFTRFPSLGFKEIETTVKSAYRRTASTFNTKKLYTKKSNQQDLF